MVLGLLAPLAVSSTTPLPPPVHEYSVRGRLGRSGGGSLADYAVTLLWARSPCPSEWRRFEDEEPAFTHGDGSFLVASRLSGEIVPACSLVVAVIFPDTMLLGTPFDEGEPYYTEAETFENTEDGFFCDETNEVTFDRRHFYFQKDVAITIP